MKSGTTSLYTYLRSHPDIYMPALKEPGFFSNEHIWCKGAHWYESLFKSHEDKKALGEASTNYTKYPHYSNVPERIAGLIPSIKLIYIVRHPIERIYSHYQHNYYTGRELHKIEEAVVKSPLYLHISLYYKQIDQYLKYFSRNQIKFILLEDLKQDPVNTVQSIYRFLEVDDSFVPENIYSKKNQTRLKKGRDSLLIPLLKKMPFFNQLSQQFSDERKAVFNQLIKQKVKEPDPVPNCLYNNLAEKLLDDTNKFSKIIDRDLNFWKLDT